MPTFDYVAREVQTGNEVIKSIEAQSQEAAINQLLKSDLLVVSIEERARKVAKSTGGKVNLRDLVIFTRQLSTMIDAGMAIVGCLESLGRQTRNKEMRDIINSIRNRIESGENFSAALTRHPKVFDRLYISMVTAGEKSGLLADNLDRLATHLEATARLRRKVKSSLIYPVMVTVVAFGITIFLLVKVVPIFKEIYENFNSKLPIPTQLMIDLSDFISGHFFILMLALGGAGYGLYYFFTTPAGRLLWDSQRIRLPMFGYIAHSICLARFTRTFSSLVRAGVPILSVMETAADACGNIVMRDAVLDARQHVEHGQNIADSLARHDVFPDIIVRMMTAGEETGKIDVMLEKIADHLDEEVEIILSGLTSLIEPLLIVFLGVLIAVLVVCMFLPIFKLSEVVTQNR